MSAAAAEKRAPFPRVFAIAIAIEFLERLAFYGVYINLAVYLGTAVGMTDLEVGAAIGWFGGVRALLPVLVGSIADRIGFKTSLVTAFAMYTFAYASLWAAPTRVLAWTALLGMSIGGAFMKPVISGCVKRYSPEGRQTEGFAIFYQSVNAGSVVGKTATKQIRTGVSLPATFVLAITASVVALFVAIFLFFEPKREDEEVAAPAERETFGALVTSTARSYVTALKEPKLAVFLGVVSGYYLLIEQFYQTFPIYMDRAFPGAPREYVTLINPASIALFQLVVARLTRRVPVLVAMPIGVATGALSMALMGAVPNLWGACGSFFVFALAEMIFSPRYYDYVGSFAPKGKEGLYMGLALLPFGIGSLAGGFLSGALVARFLPKGGPLQPFPVWGTYAAIGVVCAAMLVGYRAWAGRVPVPT